jgi:hypothetical protein
VTSEVELILFQPINLFFCVPDALSSKIEKKFDENFKWATQKWKVNQHSFNICYVRYRLMNHRPVPNELKTSLGQCKQKMWPFKAFSFHMTQFSIRGSCSRVLYRRIIWISIKRRRKMNYFPVYMQITLGKSTNLTWSLWISTLCYYYFFIRSISKLLHARGERNT